MRMHPSARGAPTPLAGGLYLRLCEGLRLLRRMLHHVRRLLVRRHPVWLGHGPHRQLQARRAQRALVALQALEGRPFKQKRKRPGVCGPKAELTRKRGAPGMY